MHKKRICLYFISIVAASCSWIYEIGTKATSEFDATEANMSITEFEYVNQNNETVSLVDLKGEYGLADMVFTNCPTVCPVMTPNMKELQDTAIEEGLNMKFVSFTVDPENDTVERLKQYTTNIGSNDDYWSFLTGYDLEEITEFALESFRSPVQQVENDFVHSTRFFLIDEKGNVIRFYDGMSTNLTEIKEDMIKTVQ
ncbi:transporter [Alkalicoccobacillus plakortidis]|uniref:Transporter n=2 Tax=Bacillaceae TaxID=186817 RepID=A0A9D5DPY0_9BACI|nr:transporter [Alkalicoccobacillus plakortidis]